MRLTRGDTKYFKFARKDAEGNIITERAEKLYFTVKPDFDEDEVVIQKTIDDMTFDEDGWYHFVLEPDDTNYLEFSAYVYDIEVYIPSRDYVQTIAKGYFILDKEVTHKRNEV